MSVLHGYVNALAVLPYAGYCTAQRIYYKTSHQTKNCSSSHPSTRPIVHTHSTPSLADHMMVPRPAQGQWPPQSTPWNLKLIPSPLAKPITALHHHQTLT